MGPANVEAFEGYPLNLVDFKYADGTIKFTDEGSAGRLRK